MMPGTRHRKPTLANRLCAGSGHSDGDKSEPGGARSALVLIVDKLLGSEEHYQELRHGLHGCRSAVDSAAVSSKRPIGRKQ